MRESWEMRGKWWKAGKLFYFLHIIDFLEGFIISYDGLTSSFLLRGGGADGESKRAIYIFYKNISRCFRVPIFRK